MRSLVIRVLIPAGITLLGLLVVGVFFLLKPKPERKLPAHKMPTVQVMEVTPRAEQALVAVNGLVTPSREVTVVPEVGGRIVSQSEQLIPGGRFDRNERLATIDQRDFRLVIQQEQSRVRQAELELQLETERQDIALREWELLGDGRPAEDAPLALRKPHLVNAEESLAAARAGLQRAELNLERTVLRAPFNAMVVEERVDVGQVVGQATSAVTLIGTDRFWIQASVPVEKLALIDIPDVNAEQGSPVCIVGQVGVGEISGHRGQVLQLLGQLDASTRTGQLLIAIDDPLAIGDGGLPLLPGAFVQVEIEGREIGGAVVVPRTAVVDGSTVWLVDGEQRLIRRQVDIGWRTEDDVIVTAGLEQGDRLVISPLHQAVAGMDVRIAGADAHAVSE